MEEAFQMDGARFGNNFKKVEKFRVIWEEDFDLDLSILIVYDICFNLLLLEADIDVIWIKPVPHLWGLYLYKIMPFMNYYHDYYYYQIKDHLTE